MIESGAIVAIEELIDKKRIKEFDALLISMPQVDCPLDMQFYPGLLIRERFVPSGTIFTTYTWKTTHPFRCIQGKLLIWEEDKGWILFEAPCKGLTLAGTKRVIYVIEDVIWETLHANPTDTQDEKELHDMLFENYQNEYLSLEELNRVNKCQALSVPQP